MQKPPQGLSHNTHNTWRAINKAMKRRTPSQQMKGIVKAMYGKPPKRILYFMSKVLRKLEHTEQRMQGPIHSNDELLRFARALVHFARDPSSVEPIEEGFVFSYKDFT